MKLKLITIDHVMLKNEQPRPKQEEEAVIIHVPSRVKSRVIGVVTCSFLGSVAFRLVDLVHVCLHIRSDAFRVDSTALRTVDLNKQKMTTSS